MTKIARLLHHIKTPADPSFTYLPVIFFVMVVLLYEFVKMSNILRIAFKQILPINDFTIPFKIAMMTTVMYGFLVYPPYGLALFVATVGYLQLEGLLDEWTTRQRRQKYDHQNLKSIAQIREVIAKQNKSEIATTTYIPKRIIQVWFNKGRKMDSDDSRKYPKKFDKYVESVQSMNPEYEYMFFDKDQAEAFLQEHYPHYYRTYLRLPVFIQKIDFFRYVAVYHYGGFYLDLDIRALKPLDDSVTRHKAVFPIDEYVVAEWQSEKRFQRFHQNGVDFLPGQYAFGAIPKHGFLKRLIETIHKNIDAYERLVRPGEQYVYSTTGPDFVTDEYMNYPEKEDIFILDNGKRQMFGDYGKHDYIGTWK